ncbi:type II toxin-antitoxin system HicA family toxin [Candidatus Parcubacteria bacterium]|nr:type II toxin-antitoxin system HicA family toxin [Candidatus Parcubacteria bacterium]
MPKLPAISGKKVIKKLEKIGYSSIRQKGSHVRLRNSDNLDCKPITVPVHKIIKPGLLCKIIKDADLSVEKFINL